MPKNTNQCIDCSTPIQYRSKRCNSCSIKHKWTDPVLRDKMVNGLIASHPRTANYNCIDCGVSVKAGSPRCNKCAALHRWKRDDFRAMVSKSVRKWAKTSSKAKEIRSNNVWFQRGTKHPRFITGITSRASILYEQWRKDVLNRDNRTCQMCGATDDLHVHHIKSYAKYPDLRTDVANGVTLCYPCHQTQHKNHVVPPQKKAK